MRVLGINPGTYTTGVGVVDSAGGELILVGYNALSPKRSCSLAERLYIIYKDLIKVIDSYKPSEVAVEAPFVSENTRTAIAIGQAQAVAFIAAARQRLPIHTYQPSQVKQAVTDYGTSSKEQVQEMISILLGLQHPPESKDASDALAVAICNINAAHYELLTMTE